MIKEQDPVELINEFTSGGTTTSEETARLRRYRHRVAERTGSQPGTSKLRKLGREALAIMTATATLTGFVAFAGEHISDPNSQSKVANSLIQQRNNPSSQLIEERIDLGESAVPPPLAGSNSIQPQPK